MKVAVIGGGAAGCMAAIEAAKAGHSVVLFEKNDKLGKKLYITGKGRCNLTNDCTRDEFFENVMRNPRFLYSALSAFGPADIMALVEGEGCPVKVERGKRVFPESDKSSDVLRALERSLIRAGVELRLGREVRGLEVTDGVFTGLAVGAGVLPFDAVVVATGGVSYASTGSTGDGYRFARELGLKTVPPTASLVPLETSDEWCSYLSGVTLKNVVFTVKLGKKTLFSELGELLFTHFGVSGPLVLSASALITDEQAQGGLGVFIDFKPALSHEQLEARLLRDIDAERKKSVGNALSGLLPARLLAVVLDLAGLDPQKSASEFTKQDRRRLAELLKALPLHVTGKRPIEEAIITRGGVAVSELDPSTLRSKKVAGLYFAGEVIDVDALTGGFNLQIAWSTGALAGRSINV